MSEEGTTESEPTEEERVLYAKLEKMVKNNVTIEEDLMRQQVRPNPTILFNIRLNLFIEAVLTDPVERLRFEIEYQNRINAVLMQIQQEQAKSRLLVPKGPAIQLHS